MFHRTIKCSTHTPDPLAQHYKNKIAVYVKWWTARGYPDGIPDEVELKIENAASVAGTILLTEAVVVDKPEENKDSDAGFGGMGGMF